ncbi:MAG TPA: hypothetical protein VJ767_09420 [Nitrososphaeraceae archaeon]|nr:hypothetical protein [Nitrososphaeraceae archaeon]
MHCITEDKKICRRYHEARKWVIENIHSITNSGNYLRGLKGRENYFVLYSWKVV